MNSKDDDIELAGLLAGESYSEDDAQCSSSSQLSMRVHEKEEFEFENCGSAERPRSWRAELLETFQIRALLGFSLGYVQSIEATSILWSPMRLAPSFLQPSYVYDWRLHSTSWLDGVRGLAAFFVFTSHFNHPWWPNVEFGFASGPGTYSIFNLPPLRLYIGGPGMVSVFFIVSGYALSYSPIQKMRKGDHVALHRSLVSSIFRRWFRLYLPTLVSTFVTMIMAWQGLWITLAPVSGPGPRGSFLAQLGEWWRGYLSMSNPTQNLDTNVIWFPPYGPQLWTLPREFKGSMILYLVMIGLASAHHLLRSLIVITFCWYTTWLQQWELALFLAGMAVAELQYLPLDILGKEGNASFQSTNQQSIKTCAHLTSIILTLLGLYLLCIPGNSNDTPGYKLITALAPPSYGPATRFWINSGSILFVLGISISANPSSESGAPPLQWLFRTRFVQYLGKISFSLYITHYWVLGTVGARIFYHWPNGFWFALPADTIMCIWVADLFWRAIDSRSVTLGKWIASKCFREE